MSKSTLTTGNPFSIMFGKTPQFAVDRAMPEQQIINEFTQDNPTQQIFLITGVRGCGKSALTGKLMNTFSDFNGWYVIDLHVEEDMRLAA